MNFSDVLSCVDHTELSPTAQWSDIERLIEEAIEFHTASVCLSPCFVRRAVTLSNGAVPIGTVIGFPAGTSDARVKAYEATCAIQDGADEIDMVLSLSHVKDHDYKAVLREIEGVRRAVPDSVLKVIIETCYLTEEEKIALCQIVFDGGADYIKTSTGFGSGGATFEDVKLLRRHAPATLKIKAAGGIRGFEDARRFLLLGADRLGTSRLVRLAKEQVEKENER